MREYDPSDWYWFVLENETIYSSKRGTAISPDDQQYVSFLQSGNLATVCATFDDLVGVQRRNNCPPYHRVAKSTVISRLGKIKSEQAFALASIDQQLRWNAPDKPMVNSDDQETLEIIRLVGGDPNEVLAPEV